MGPILMERCVVSRQSEEEACSHPVCRAARWSVVDGESRLCTVTHMDSITCADADLYLI